MRPSWRRHSIVGKGRCRWILFVCALFVVGNAVRFWHARGDDLASSYVGCRVLASGHAGSLYSYDPVNFAGISESNPDWPRAASSGGYTSYLHPYVQTPLWAWALQPACLHLQFPAFEHMFLLWALASLAGSVYLTSRYWTPHLHHPLAVFVVLAALSSSEPFVYAMDLVQTHALLLLLTIAGIVLAQRKRPIAAGLCVALAAAIKLTPGVLLVYWLLTRRWRAAASLVLWSAVLLLATRISVGTALVHDYFADLHRVSHLLLVSENNQSLAAWYMGRFFSPDEVFDVNAYPLPNAVRLVSMACMLAFTTLGGLFDGGWLQHRKGSPDKQAAVPFGAGMALVAMTIFAPIAWTHYFVVLAVPLMLLAEAATGHAAGAGRRWLLSAVVLCAAALLFRPFAPDVGPMDLGDYAILRGEFYAGTLCGLALMIVAAEQHVASAGRS